MPEGKYTGDYPGQKNIFKGAKVLSEKTFILTAPWTGKQKKKPPLGEDKKGISWGFIPNSFREIFP